MSFSLDTPRRARRPSLSPMIDVVFLLLVFFMLASRFGADMQVPLKLAGQGNGYSGPPRLVDVQPVSVMLNGITLDQSALIAQLETLTDKAEDTIILRAKDEATLQRIVEVMELLGGEGYTSLVLVE